MNFEFSSIHLTSFSSIANIRMFLFHSLLTISDIGPAFLSNGPKKIKIKFLVKLKHE
jgi:hypothetical protein